MRVILSKRTSPVTLRRSSSTSSLVSASIASVAIMFTPRAYAAARYHLMQIMQKCLLNSITLSAGIFKENAGTAQAKCDRRSAHLGSVRRKFPDHTAATGHPSSEVYPWQTSGQCNRIIVHYIGAKIPSVPSVLNSIRMRHTPEHIHHPPPVHRHQHHGQTEDYDRRPHPQRHILNTVTAAE